jgi:hypothetical protein
MPLSKQDIVFDAVCYNIPGVQEQPTLATSMTNVARMRMRAAANVSFVYVKIPPVQACISYKACAKESAWRQIRNLQKNLT